MGETAVDWEEWQTKGQWQTNGRDGRRKGRTAEMDGWRERNGLGTERARQGRTDGTDDWDGRGGLTKWLRGGAT